MLGLINRAFEGFVRDTYGQHTWGQVTDVAGLRFDRFESMLHYDPDLTEAVIRAACQVLQRPRDSVMEDVGIYLVSNPNLERLRRLLRFGGVDFLEFLHSLEDMPERGRLALPELQLPQLRLLDMGDGIFRLQCHMDIAGIGHVVVGLLRAMADDYGALALIDYDTCLPNGGEVVAIHLLDHRHSSGRSFDLSAMLQG